MIDVVASSCRMDFFDAWELGSIRPWEYLGEPGLPSTVELKGDMGILLAKEKAKK